VSTDISETAQRLDVARFARLQADQHIRKRAGPRLTRRLGELGSGSFGRVYQARQLSTGQSVAIKRGPW